MGLILSSRQSTGGGGGGGGQNILPDRRQLILTTAFVAGAITITLPNTPMDSDGVLVYYNGVYVLPGAGGYLLSTNIITLDFSDDPTLYDNGQCIVSVHYWYNA